MQTARLPASLLRVGKYKERGCWVHFQKDWCLHSALFPSWSFLEMVSGSGQEQYLWYLSTGPIHLWSDIPWGPLVCCGLWGALGCSAPVLHNGPGLNCQDLKNINLKDIVKKINIWGGDALFFQKQVVCWRLRWFAVFKSLLLWHIQSV